MMTKIEFISNECDHTHDAEYIGGIDNEIKWYTMQGIFYTTITAYDDNSGQFTHCPICEHEIGIRYYF